MACYFAFLTTFVLSVSLSSSQNLKPVIVEEPPDQFPREGVLNFGCKATGNPEPVVTWYDAVTHTRADERQSLPSGDLPVVHTNVMGQLVIPEPKSGKVYEFYCNASNIHGWTVSRVAKAGHAYLYDTFNQDPMDKEARVGVTVMLLCKPPEGMPPPSVTWEMYAIDTPLKDIRNGVGKTLEVTETTQGRIQLTSNQHLRIQEVDVQDTGIYVCIAKNSAGVRRSSSSTLTVRQKPRFQEMSEDKSVRLGEDVTFRCVLKGEQPVSWTREGGMPERTTIVGMSVTIRNVQRRDAGNYICRSGSLEGVVKLTVDAEPTFSYTPEDKTVKEGANVTFQCICSSNTFWELPNGRNVLANDKNDPRKQVYSDGRLELKSVSVDDDGKYLCTCINHIGIVKASVVLTVTPLEVPPVIALGPQDQVLFVGSTATFRCEAEDPSKTITKWYLNNNTRTPVEFHDPRIVASSSTFQINDVQPSHSQNYTCIAEKGVLSTRWTARLVVLGKGEDRPVMHALTDVGLLPKPPRSLEVIDVAPTSITLKWQSVGGYSDFRVELTEPESSKGWIIVEDGWKGDMIQINGLSPGHEYSFLVRARNEFGLGRPSKLTRFVRTGATSLPNLPITAGDTNKIKNVVVDNLQLSSLSFRQVKVMWNVEIDRGTLPIIGGYSVKNYEVPVNRCYENLLRENQASLYCSLVQSDQLERLQNYLNRLHHVLEQERQTNSKSFEVVNDIHRRHDSYPVQLQTAVIAKLKPFRCYEFTVEPFSVNSTMGVVRGRESSSTVALTYEDIPSAAPSSITARWVNNQTIHIAWLPPSPAFWNGLLQRYIIYIFGNDSKYRDHKVVDFGETSKELRDMNPNMNYIIHIAAENCKGLGVRSGPYSLQSLYYRSSDSRHSVTNKPWFIAVMIACGIFWLLLCVLICYLCQKQRHVPCLLFCCYPPSHVKTGVLKTGKENIELLSKQQNGDHFDSTTCMSRLTQHPDLTLQDSQRYGHRIGGDYQVTNKSPSSYDSHDMSPGDKSSAPYYSALPSMPYHPTAHYTGTDVAPYASTSIINLGPFSNATLNRPPPPGMHQQPPLANGLYYASEGMYPMPNHACNAPYSEFSDSQYTDEWSSGTGGGRHVPNIGEIIPPPPQYPPPPAPPYCSSSSIGSPPPLPPLDGGDNLTRSTNISREPSSHGSHKMIGSGIVQRPAYSSSSSAITSATRERRATSAERNTTNQNTGRQGGSASEEDLVGAPSYITPRYPSTRLDEEETALEEDSMAEFVNSSVVNSTSSEGEEEELQPTQNSHPNSPTRNLETRRQSNDILQPLTSVSAPKRSRAHSPDYSTDTSSYSVLPSPPPRPYPKSERKKHMKQSNGLSANPKRSNGTTSNNSSSSAQSNPIV